MNKRFSLFLLTALCASAPVATQASGSAVADVLKEQVTIQCNNYLKAGVGTFITTGLVALVSSEIRSRVETTKKKVVSKIASIVIPAATIGALTYLYLNNPEAFKATALEGASLVNKGARQAAAALYPHLPTKEAVIATTRQVASYTAEKASCAFAYLAAHARPFATRMASQAHTAVMEFELKPVVDFAGNTVSAH